MIFQAILPAKPFVRPLGQPVTCTQKQNADQTSRR
jgi:hypothetical protein